MKKLIAVSIILLTIISCVPKLQEIVDDYHTVVVIEDCQYIIIRDGYRGYMAHKGNCTNCIKRER